ncbi:MAG: GAF domain-containing sensor histidine kinase [Anaerolineae bacterium]|nr:GAF domain-containing sensor histidine kinase [Anaerolineae bacterium]
MNLKDVVEHLASAAKEILAADAAAVFLEAEGKALAFAGGVGFPDVPLPAQGLPQEAVQRQEPLQAEEVGEKAGLPEGMRAALCVPLVVPGEPLGALCVYRREPCAFSERDVACLRALAKLGGMAIGAVQDLAEQERIEAAKARFIHVATHELRSPITVAQSLVRNVLKGYAGPLTDQQRDVFSRISGRLDFLETLVNDLLDLAASRAPELAEKEGPVAINASVGRAVLLLDPRAEEKGLSLTVQRCKEELAVWATEEGMDRIFVNLIGNAIKYTPPGGQVTVVVRKVGDEAQVEVSDTGIGIPEEAIPHLFEEFYRAPNARAFNAVGTGLGLAIVKELVDRYRGRIEVKSRVGEGTTFTISFPLWRKSA